jgi:hypothetical protein
LKNVLFNIRIEGRLHRIAYVQFSRPWEWCDHPEKLFSRQS